MEELSIIQKVWNFIKNLFTSGIRVKYQQEISVLLDENRALKEENIDLKKAQDLEECVEIHQKPFITFSNDKEKIRYCAICWGNNRKMIPLYVLDDKSSNKRHFCNLCQNRFISE